MARPDTAPNPAFRCHDDDRGGRGRTIHFEDLCLALHEDLVETVFLGELADLMRSPDGHGSDCDAVSERLLPPGQIRIHHPTRDAAWTDERDGYRPAACEEVVERDLA